MSNTIGIIMYTDGGCRGGTPGFIGWGMHGYKYDATPSKVGSGLAKYNITEEGYIPTSNKNPKINTVTPIEYYDFIGSSLEPKTNNIAELEAVISSLEFIKTNQLDQMTNGGMLSISSIKIYTDSEYVRKGINEGLPTWSKNGWKRHDGNLLANDKLWRALHQFVLYYASVKIKLEVNWVQAHNDNFGNEKADQLATIGVMHSTDHLKIEEYNISPAKGYWKINVNRHPFLDHKRMYFNSRSIPETKGYYFMANPGDGNVFVGRKVNDACYSMVKLNYCDPIIETVKKLQDKNSMMLNTIMLLKLDNLFKPEVYSKIAKYGEYALVPGKNKLIGIDSLDQTSITVEQNPPLLALRAIEVSEILVDLLNAINDGDDLSKVIGYSNLQLVDITDTFYSNNKLHDKYVVGYSDIVINVPYAITDYVDPTFIVTDCINLDINLVLGSDLPSRNTLKRIESLKPIVRIALWQDNSTTVKYASVVSINEAIGIWTSYYANFKLLPNSKPSIARPKNLSAL